MATKQEKKAANQELMRLEKEGLIEKYGGKKGCYIRQDDEWEEMDYVNASSELFPIKWPLEVESMVSVHPGELVLIAGEPNAGKTGFLLNTVKMNFAPGRKFYYFTSEMSAGLMKARLSLFGFPLQYWKENGLTVVSKATGLATAVAKHPDDINIIDFLEISDKFWEVAGILRDIFEKIRHGKGLLLVALQKGKGKEYGRGGDFTLEKPALYLTISKNVAEGGEILKIAKGKTWAPGCKVNPDGRWRPFTIGDGTHIRPIKGDHLDWR